MVLLTYVDDCIIISPSIENIDRLIKSMQQGRENFILTDEGDINKFLGIEITKLDNHSFELSQPFLINRILSFLGLCNNDFETDANSSSTPVAKGLLHRDLAGKSRKYSWNYRTAVGMIPTFKIRLVLRFRWPLIKPLVSRIVQCFLTRNPLCESDVSCLTRASAALFTSRTCRRVSNVT